MDDKGRQISDLLQVLEMSRKLATSRDLQSLLTQIENAAVKVLDSERATVFVHDLQTGDLYSYVSARKEKIRFPANQGIAGACFNSGKLLNIPDAYQDPRFDSAVDKSTGFTTRNILATPLLDDNQKPLGVLEVLNKSTGAFDGWDATLLETFAAQIDGSSFGIRLFRWGLDIKPPKTLYLSPTLMSTSNDWISHSSCVQRCVQ